MEAPVAEIAERVAARAGLRPPEWVLQARATERARARGVDVERYAALLAGDPQELDELIEALRVGETRFFRHQAQVEALEKLVVPQLARARAATRRVRAWSAGCATGEEAYTLAMLLGDRLPGWTVEVLGTDLSDDALAEARAGRYPAAEVARLDESIRRRWFTPSGAEVVVAPRLAQAVGFERRNLLDAPPPGPWDVILCRNVLMYFDPDTRREVIARITGALADDGFFLVGYAESARDAASLQAVEAGVYRKREEGIARTPGRQRELEISGSLARPSLASGRPGDSDPSEPLRLMGTPTAAEVSELLRDALEAGAPITVDLDGADYLDDEVATVMRRAAAAARAAGIELTIVATRPGHVRWLARQRLS